MLHNRRNPATVKKAYAYAAVAKAEGADFVYFSPKCVNFDTQRINGYKYIDGAWEKTETSFPDVIYNAGASKKLSTSKDILVRLKETIPFTSYSIGNKLNVYNRLKEFKEFSKYVIPSEAVDSEETLLNFLDLYNKVVFKPVDGHMGQDVYFIEKSKDTFNVTVETQKYNFILSEIKEFLWNKLKKDAYIVQPYISSKTKAGISYVLRLHVQKDEEDKWTITSIYPQFAANGSIVSNIASGGSTNYLEPFLKQEFGVECFNIKRYLEIFSIQLASHMDKIQKTCFSETLDELGIDVGLDDSGKIWIYEINWRPGCPPAFYLELDVVIKNIRYAMHLAKQYKKTYC